MFCVECFQYRKVFLANVCVDCFPAWVKREWFGSLSSRCVFEDCNAPPVVKNLRLCPRHRRLFWGLGGKSPKGGKWTNPDGTRKKCSTKGCKFVVESSGLCVHHYHNYKYETGRGRLKSTKYQKKVNYDGTPVICDFKGCLNPVFNHPWCSGHYYQGLRGEDLTPLREKALCNVHNCDVEVSVKLNSSGICDRHRGLMRRFSLSVEKLFDLHRPENLKCENPGCSSKDNLHLDHDHKCCPYKKNGTRSCGLCVRGWLCQGCNTSLGNLQENPRRIQGLLEYLDLKGGVQDSSS